MVTGGGSLARRWGRSFLGCGTSVGDLARGFSLLSRALFSGASVGEMNQVSFSFRGPCLAGLL